MEVLNENIWSFRNKRLLVECEGIKIFVFFKEKTYILHLKLHFFWITVNIIAIEIITIKKQRKRQILKELRNIFRINENLLFAEKYICLLTGSKPSQHFLHTHCSHKMTNSTNLYHKSELYLILFNVSICISQNDESSTYMVFDILVCLCKYLVPVRSVMNHFHSICIRELFLHYHIYIKWLHVRNSFACLLIQTPFSPLKSETLRNKHRNSSPSTFLIHCGTEFRFVSSNRQIVMLQFNALQ